MKKFRPTNLAYGLVVALLLSGSTVLTSCTNSEIDKTPDTHISGSKDYSKPIKSIDQITPTYEFKRWDGEYYLTIDEESLEQIIKLAMKNAQSFYLGIGSYNMKLDKDLNNMKGENNFYTDWMNPEFFMARAKQESSELFMVNYRANLNEDINKDPCGIMQINPNSVKETLMQYYRDIYHEDINLMNIQVFPNESDVEKAETSKKAQKNITQTIYNNVYLSICFDIYEAKCLNPGHTDYYSRYGGYSEDLRRQATIAAYLFSHDDVVESLINGSFNELYGSTEYVQNITQFQKEFENKNVREKYYNGPQN